MRGFRGIGAVALAAGGLVLGGCGGGGGAGTPSSSTPAPPTQPPPPVNPPSAPTVAPPVVMGGYAFYGVDQGLSATVHDVSADEGGNVYVAAGDAVYARARTDRDFRKFTPDQAGLTRNCHDPQYIKTANPPDAPATCPVISVAGAAAGKAVIGFQGVGIDYDYDAPWALDSGGADLLSFDGTSLTRDRHVSLASPPGVVCEQRSADGTTCLTTWTGSTWVSGRKKMRQVLNVVVNHDASRPLSYGDVYFGATHGSLGILAAHPDQRGWIDTTKGDPAWADTKGVWEHEHPAKSWPDGRFLTGQSTGLALDPITGVPWFSNQFFTTSFPSYATIPHPAADGYWSAMTAFLAFWQPQGNPDDVTLRDNVSGLSFCGDGTLWVASSNHGIGHLDTATGAFTPVALPNGYGNAASAIACDPSDGSIWVGFTWGGFARWKGGAWTGFVPQNAPQFTWNPVLHIQIDRWATPRIVYLAHVASAKYGPGGVTVYTGP